ncbi:MAG: hypothetical protein U1E22_11005 [Coriobacteriia bacterium]|nr:hypothetical protein [Coriobacteriia bacterium]
MESPLDGKESDAEDTRDHFEDAVDRTDGATVLDVFGVSLKVHNPRLAEILTMDAREALASDVRDLADGSAVRAAQAETAQALPDVLIAQPTPHEADNARARTEMRQIMNGLGSALGFDVRPDGVWISPTGFTVVTRAVHRPVSLAAAADFIDKVEKRRRTDASPDSSTLVVVDTQQTADVFKVAIRQRRAYETVRTISLDNLRFVRYLCSAEVVDHHAALALLTPAADVDVGELLSIVRSAAAASDAVLDDDS